MEASFFNFLKDFFEATGEYNRRISQLCEAQTKMMQSQPKPEKPKAKPVFRKTMGYQLFKKSQIAENEQSEGKLKKKALTSKINEAWTGMDQEAQNEWNVRARSERKAARENENEVSAVEPTKPAPDLQQLFEEGDEKIFQVKRAPDIKEAKKRLESAKSVSPDQEFKGDAGTIPENPDQFLNTDS